MNHDDLEIIAKWLEDELSRYTIAVSLLVCIVIVAVFFAFINVIGFTAFAVLESIGAMLIIWLIASAYLRWRQKRLLRDAVQRVEKMSVALRPENADRGKMTSDGRTTTTAEDFYAFLSARSMIYALAFHVMARTDASRIRREPENDESVKKTASDSEPMAAVDCER